MGERRYLNAANVFTNAIEKIANKPENLNNFRSYLTYHFLEWLRLYANDSDGLAEEMKIFAEMEINL